MFHRIFRGLSANQRHPVLNIARVCRSDKFQFRHPVIFQGHQQQVALWIRLRVIQLRQYQQGFLCHQAQAVGRLRAPVLAHGESVQEFLDLFQGAHVQVRFQPAPFRAGQVDKNRQQDGREAAGRHAVSQRAAQPIVQVLRK